MKDPTPYRKVLPTRLYDARSRLLSPNGKHLDAYLHIGPQTNRTGLYPFSIGKAMEDTGLSRRAVLQGLEELRQVKGHQFDPEHELLLVADHWRHEAPDNGSQIVGYAKELALVACGSVLIDDFIQHIDDIPNPKLRDFFRALAEFARTGLLPEYDEMVRLAGNYGVALRESADRRSTTPSATPSTDGVGHQKQQQTTAGHLQNQESRDGKDAAPLPPVKVSKSAAKSRPVFQGSRFALFQWQVDELMSMLGPHAEAFDVGGWLHELSRMADGEVAVVPDWWAWVRAKTLEEAVRRGLPVVTAAATAPSKQTQRLATAMAQFREMVDGSRNT